MKRRSIYSALSFINLLFFHQHSYAQTSMQCDFFESNKCYFNLDVTYNKTNNKIFISFRNKDIIVWGLFAKTINFADRDKIRQRMILPASTKNTPGGLYALKSDIFTINRKLSICTKYNNYKHIESCNEKEIIIPAEYLIDIVFTPVNKSHPLGPYKESLNGQAKFRLNRDGTITYTKYPFRYDD